MNKLLCVIPYHQGDLQLAQNLLLWIAELGGCRNHACILAADNGVPKETRMELKQRALQSFDFVETLVLDIPKTGHLPNHMFMLTAREIMQRYKWPWLWLEPDAVPLKPGWLDALAEEYANSPKRFLGNLIEANQPGLPHVHLTGVSIYPPDAYTLYDEFASIKSANVAWDMEAASAVVPKAANSNLMSHFWGKRDLPPTFVKEKTNGHPINALPLSFIKPNAVLYHRNKDGTLIQLLRETRIASAEPVVPEPIASPRRGRPPKQSIPAPMIHAT